MHTRPADVDEHARIWTENLAIVEQEARQGQPGPVQPTPPAPLQEQTVPTQGPLQQTPLQQGPLQQTPLQQGPPQQQLAGQVSKEHDLRAKVDDLEERIILERKLRKKAMDESEAARKN